MKRIVNVLIFCATVAVSMVLAQNQLPKLYPYIEVVNNTKHNLFITDADTEKIILRLKPGETKKTTIDFEEHGFYWIESMTNGKPETIGNFATNYHLLESPHPLHYSILMRLDKCRTINNIDAKDNMSDHESDEEYPCQDTGIMDYIDISSSIDQAPQRIDLSFKLILEGNDLSKSRIEDLTGVVH